MTERKTKLVQFVSKLNNIFCNIYNISTFLTNKVETKIRSNLFICNSYSQKKTFVFQQIAFFHEIQQKINIIMIQTIAILFGKRRQKVNKSKIDVHKIFITLHLLQFLSCSVIFMFLELSKNVQYRDKKRERHILKHTFTNIKTFYMSESGLTILRNVPYYAFQSTFTS